MNCRIALPQGGGPRRRRWRRRAAGLAHERHFIEVICAGIGEIQRGRRKLAEIGAAGTGRWSAGAAAARRRTSPPGPGPAAHGPRGPPGSRRRRARPRHSPASPHRGEGRAGAATGAGGGRRPVGREGPSRGRGRAPTPPSGSAGRTPRLRVRATRPDAPGVAVQPSGSGGRSSWPSGPPPRDVGARPHAESGAEVRFTPQLRAPAGCV